MMESYVSCSHWGLFPIPKPELPRDRIDAIPLAYQPKEFNVPWKRGDWA